MGLFKEKQCAECGNKAGLLSRIHLADDNYLCGDCGACIPAYMLDTVRKHYTIDDFRSFKIYLDAYNDEYQRVFSANQSYYSLKVDTEHKLFYIGSSFDKNPVILRLCDIEDFDLVFSAEEFKEGTFSDKVYGKILLSIKHSYPYFYYETVLDSHVKAPAKQSFFGKKVEYSNPQAMDEFITFFNLARSKALNEELARLESEMDDSENEYNNIDASSAELMQAMALFMYDNLENVSLSELRSQRNRLMKAYHPDSGSEEDNKYAQKINHAYELLKHHIEQH